MENNNNKGVIALLIIIIIILSVLCVLFATGTISLSTKNNTETITEEQQKELSTDDSDKIVEEDLSYFEANKNLDYTDNLKDDINGKIAIIKMGEKVFQTEKYDNYYTYTDNFNNSYYIKEITNIKSEYKMTGNDNWAYLYKAEVEYLDKDNNKKTFDTAVIIPTAGTSEYIMGPYENYTGSTSFVRGFTDLYTD